ncbi:MAG: copper amine oxidase N-terminal domain-containing protein [Candidatus Eremiobacteraeota bacterium]|nr:copper amine oxidase N-terminal domain-containing protein [Candidatus Eremiobacteraeota bacterium]
MHCTRSLGAVLVAGMLALGATVALAADVSIIVNGQQVQFDQPPIERSGRVFVPLRGVFERLGASVVYDNGIINASGNGRTIQLKIGSTTAVVNGTQHQLDVAPFIVGSRTLVPLRFISESLGANVDYNDTNRTVSINLGGSTQSGVHLLNLTPASDAVVAAKSPAVSGSFSSRVDPNSVHITLDGRDVSSTSDISSSDFLFTPPYPLTPERHTVRVTGRAADGSSFEQSWSFTSGTSVVPNYITNIHPANGTSVNGSFALSGTTLPNSSVHIVAIPSALVGGIFPVTSGTYVADIKADSQGHFSQTLGIQPLPGGTVSVRITSIAPTTNESKTVDLKYNS